MKRIFSCILLLAMLAGLLSACADKEPEESNGGNNAGKTTITLYAREFEQWANKHVQEMVDRFNAQSETIYVQVKFFSGDTYTDALTVARENGKSPDLYMLEYGSVFNHARYNYAAKLDDLLPQEALDDIPDNVRDMVSYKGGVYAYPWQIEPATLLFYRKDILNENGISSAPTTWQELYDACAKLKTTRDLGQYCLGLPVSSVEYAWVTYGMQMNTCGTLAVDDTWMVSNIENEGYKQLCSFFYEIYRNGYAPSAAITTEGYTYIVDALCEGKLAMTFGGSWSIAEIYQHYPEMAEKIGVTPIPTIDGDSSGVTSGIGGWTFCISSDSKKQEAAVEFLKWLLIDDAARAGEYFVKAYHSKAAPTASVQKYLQTVETSVDPEWIRVLNEVAATGIPEAQYPWDISYAVGQMFETMQVGASSSDFASLYASALDTAKRTIESVMNRTSYEGNPNLAP